MPSKGLSYRSTAFSQLGCRDDQGNHIDSGNLMSSSGSVSSESSPVNTKGGPAYGGDVHQSLHYRTNFGKERGYVPPCTSSPSRANSTKRLHREERNKDAPVRSPHTVVQVMLDHVSENKDLHFRSIDEVSKVQTMTPLDLYSQPIALKPSSPESPTPRRRPVSDTESSPDRSHDPPVCNDLDPEVGRFTMSAPKLSDPTPVDYMQDELMPRRDTARDEALRAGLTAAETSGLASNIYTSRERQRFGFEDLGISSSTATERTQERRDVSSIDDPERAPNAVHDRVEPSNVFVISLDEDSLFDFPQDEKGTRSAESSRKASYKHRRRARQNMPPEGEDDGSLEELYGTPNCAPTSLQERAQQAWASRRANVNLLKAKEDAQRPTDIASPSNEDTVGPGDEDIADVKPVRRGVSFGAEDTVHHFEQDIEEDTTYYSLDERSLNSEYTKTLESEVEDAIKDILLIGNSARSKPGRRKIKYRPDVQRRLRKKHDWSKREDNEVPRHRTFPQQELDEVSGASQCVDSRLSKEEDSIAADNPQAGSKVPKSDRRSSRKGEEQPSCLPSKGAASRQPRLSKLQEDDPFLIMWDFVDHGVNAMTTAWGYMSSEVTKSATQVDKSVPKGSGSSAKCCYVPQGKSSKTHANKSASTNGAAKSDNGIYTSSFAPFMGERASTEPDIQRLRSISPTEAQNQVESIVYQAQDLFYGPLPSGGSTVEPKSLSTSVEHSTAASNSLADENDFIKELSLSSTFASDSQLKELATHAARSYHQVRGVSFDESTEISLYSDVTFSVVELTLPLGLIFLENDGGCFVTKVSPDGSASRCGGVEVGDQLAAINGTSSIKMKVDDICSLITKSRNPKSVELVFIRYEGPLRPGSDPPQIGTYDFDEGLDSGMIRNPKYREEPRNSRNESSKKSKRGFLWFGRGKKGEKK